ncbi:hypothetical protein PDE_00096 [Penicillium oxalicum 114-2]|uniref:Cation transporter n=1 Tax=Penicillium oxalicum (strain 114-2 / CGMCC 5302) TaxID=933388 RepID=S7Z3R7_PENO1|nr:hypothetical protein PDE_00096 [Penicillium oxalicum 114-2]
MASLLESKLLPLHLAYFFLFSMIGSGILYATSTQIVNLPYVDALFMSVSAMTGAGLSVVDPSVLGTLPQITIFILFILGHSIPINGVITLLRALSLRKRLIRGQEATEKGHIDCQESLPEKHMIPTEICSIVNPAKSLSPLKTNVTDREIPADGPSPVGSEDMRHSRGPLIFTFARSPSRVSAGPTATRERPKLAKLGSVLAMAGSKIDSLMAHKDHVGTLNTTSEDWTEYRALMIISVSTLSYAVICPLIGILSVGFWFQMCRPDVPREDGVAPFWAGAFLVMSSFANNGMSLVNRNMEPFQREAAPLLICGILILAGNTLFPCLLRLVIWTSRRMIPLTPKWAIWRQTFDLVLTQPQNLCGFLYPAGHTWFLVGTVVLLNVIMWGGFELAALRDLEIGTLPPKFRVLDGLFQAFAIRGGGFAVVAIDKLPQALLVIYAIMMYLSALPTCAAFKDTFSPQISEAGNASCLEAGVAGFRNGTRHGAESMLCRSTFYYERLRSHLSRDMWWLSFAVIIICVAESRKFIDFPLAFSTFNIIFEVVSAYSFVGVSVGYPGKTYAFCGEWTSFSKLLLIMISVVGRHRDVPNMIMRKPRFVNIDQTVHRQTIAPGCDLELVPAHARLD